MRLAYVDTEGLIKVTDNVQQSEPYVILSHTWGHDNAEVTYKDIRDGTGVDKLGWEKLRFMARRAKELKVKHFWVDTCCIDKSDDAELVTAIRSMFRWYAEAKVCFVYLQDISTGKRDREGAELWRYQFRGCRWMQRGWTLQELLAPKAVRFYVDDVFLGDRSSLCEILHEVTGVDKAALQGQALDTFSHRQRLEWAAGRETKVAEDMAYCLMGICGITMSPRYGEGRPDARQRLEGKITKRYGLVALESNLCAVPVVQSTTEVMMDRLKFELMDARKQTIRKALSSTCAWILQHEYFVSWTAPSRRHHGFLWIKGKPGTGKSVLMRFIDSHISDHKEEGDVCISFYFNARGGMSIEQNFIGLYRTLLSQLLLAVPDLQTVLERCQPGFEGNVEALQTLFMTACRELGQRRLFCLIDALDECKEDDIAMLIEFCKALGQEASDNQTSVLICFASRHYPIVDIPTPLKIVLEETDHHVGDLKSYIGRELKLPNPVQAEEVIEAIVRKANGIFLWVELVVKILRQEYRDGRIHAVQKRLEDMPAGLEELFKDIVQRDCRNLDEFLLCLLWILHAKRPLKLVEFYCAMMLSVDKTYQWNQTGTDLDAIHRYLVSSSKGLANLTKGRAQRVQFIHESVRDWLITHKGFDDIRQGWYTSEAAGHDILKGICAEGLADAGMCFEAAKTRVLGEHLVLPQERSRIVKDFPFLDYSISFVLVHANEAALEIAQNDFLQHFKLDDWRYKANVLHNRQVDYYDGSLCMAYLCAEHNFARLLNTLADIGHNLSQNVSRRNGTALLVAISTTSLEAVRVVLERTGAVNIEDILGEISGDRKHSGRVYDQAIHVKWHAAVEDGHDNLALYLLNISSKAPTEVELHYGMAKAIESGCMKAIRFIFSNIRIRWLSRRYYTQVETSNRAALETYRDNLLSLLAEANTEPACGEFIHVSIAALAKEGNTNYLAQLRKAGIPLAAFEGALVWLCRRFDDLVAIDALFALGVAANAALGPGKTALRAACRKGSSLVIKLLLDRGADINNIDGDHGSALQVAIESGRLENVNILIERGADVDQMDRSSTSPLIAAVWQNDLSIIMLLIERGADIDQDTHEHGNALQAACYAGRLEVAKLLIEQGADVNAIHGIDVVTALQAAARQGRVEVVKLLLAAGAKLDSLGGRFGTALQAAAYTHHRGGPEVVTLLLEAGAEVNAQGGFYGNALQAAAHHGGPETVKLLLEAGAEANASGGHYGNALQAAAYQSDPETVKLLLEAGAEVNASGGRFGNALQAAAYKGRLEATDLLLEAGAAVNARGGHHETALQAAAFCDNYEVLKLLLAAGACDYEHAESDDGRFSALDAAARRKSSRSWYVVRSLLDSSMLGEAKKRTYFWTALVRSTSGDIRALLRAHIATELREVAEVIEID